MPDNESTRTARDEIADWDPFATRDEETNAPVDEDEPKRPTKSQRALRRKERRAAPRDLSAAVRRYVGHYLTERETEGRYGRPVVDDAVVIDIANALNVKTNWVLRAWRCWNPEDGELSENERQQGERAVALGRGHAAIRHLIAIAHDPFKASEDEVESAMTALAFVDQSDLRLVAADIALAVDLAEQVRKLSASTFPRIYEIYKRIVDGDPDVRTYVVNYSRDWTTVESIYPPTEDPAEEAS